MDLLPALVSLWSRLLTGVGDEAKSFPAFHRKSDLTATLSGFIQLPLNHMLNTYHWRWDRANSGIECLSLWYWFEARTINDSGMNLVVILISSLFICFFLVEWMDRWIDIYSFIKEERSNPSLRRKIYARMTALSHGWMEPYDCLFLYLIEIGLVLFEPRVRCFLSYNK